MDKYTSSPKKEKKEETKTYFVSPSNDNFFALSSKNLCSHWKTNTNMKSCSTVCSQTTF